MTDPVLVRINDEIEDLEVEAHTLEERINALSAACVQAHLDDDLLALARNESWFSIRTAELARLRILIEQKRSALAAAAGMV